MRGRSRWISPLTQQVRVLVLGITPGNPEVRGFEVDYIATATENKQRGTTFTTCLLFTNIAQMFKQAFIKFCV